MIKLNLDSKGVGTGQFYNSVKLRFNKKHELEIEDFNSIPDDIRQVRLDKPKFPATTQATAVAAATAPTSVPASGNAPATTTQPAPATTSANIAAPGAKAQSGSEPAAAPRR